VRLYRLCGRPELSADSDFSGTAQGRSALEFIEAIRLDGRARFVDLIIDGVEHVSDRPISPVAETIEFSLRLPQDSANTFHANLWALLERVPQIGRGEMPDEFYLVEEDFFSPEDEPPATVRSLRSIVRLIHGLANLAYYRDEAEDGYNLVFLQPQEEAMPRPVELRTRVSEEMIVQARFVETQLVDELVHAEAEHDPHYSARVGVFGTALAQFVSGYPPARAFERLVQDWDAVARVYQQDLATYLSGFAFHKARREVSSAELDLAARLSAVITDIAGKILSVPVSMVAVVAMVRTTGLAERLLLLVGIGVAALLLAGAVRNQQSHLERVAHAKELTLAAVRGRREGFPDELREEVERMKDRLDGDERRLRRWLCAFYGLSLLPLVAALVVLVWLYRAPFASAALWVARTAGA